VFIDKFICAKIGASNFQIIKRKIVMKRKTFLLQILPTNNHRQYAQVPIIANMFVRAGGRTLKGKTGATFNILGIAV
jgi:hypothetical protein